MKTILSIILAFIFSTSVVCAKSFRCILYDQGQIVFDQTLGFADEQVEMTLMKSEKVQIDALAMVELVVIRAMVNDVQSQSMGHLGTGVLLSDTSNDNLSLYALCEIDTAIP